MALGKNLKKRKLIEEEPQSAPKKASSKKKKAIGDKSLIAKQAKKTAKKAAPKKNKTTTKKSTTSKKAAAPKKPQPSKAVKTTKKSKVVKKSKPKVTIKAAEEVPAPPKPQVDAGLPIYIAKELYDLKTSLRSRYKEDIANLKGQIIQFVVVEIGSEQYAIDIDCVKEVVPSPNLSLTPNTPHHIQGIANVRGATYVVFDLTKKFRLEGEYHSNYLLVIDYKGMSAALSLNTLPTTRKVNGDHISSEMHMVENASLDVSYIKGLIQDDGQLIYYLDIIELLKNDKAIVVPDNLVDTPK